MIFFAEMSMIVNDVLRLSDVNNFLKMLTIFKSRSFELTKRCLKREALNSFNFDNVAFVNGEEFNSRSKSEIFESR